MTFWPSSGGDEGTVRIYLTGGSGYIGGALAKRLVEAGHDLTCLVRATSDRSTLEEIGVSCVEGDLLAPRSLGEGLEGADWVVHAAAELDFRASEERMREINVTGSEAVAERALELGVPRFLNISSMAAFGGSPANGTPGDEDSAVIEPLPSKYARSKLAGAQALDRLAERSNRRLRLVHVYPSLVYGPPGKARGSNSMLRQMVQGGLPVVIGADRWLTWVHVDDVVDGIARLLQGRGSEARYLLAGDPIRIGSLIERVSGLAGIRPPRVKLSPGMAKLALRCLGRLARRKGLLVARENLDNLARHWHFSDRRARQDLDWSPRSLEESLPEIVRWMKRTS